MADEAVVRIVLQEDQAAQREASQALLRGEAMPWAPPNQPIQPPAGMRPDQAEFLRLEAEAARAGVSVKERRKQELAGQATVGAASASVPAGQPPEAPTPAFDTSPQVPTVDPHEERRKLNEERARLRAEKVAAQAAVSVAATDEALEARQKQVVADAQRAGLYDIPPEMYQPSIGKFPEPGTSVGGVDWGVGGVTGPPSTEAEGTEPAFARVIAEEDKLAEARQATAEATAAAVEAEIDMGEKVDYPRPPTAGDRAMQARKDDEERRQLELEAHAYLNTVRKQQEAAAAAVEEAEAEAIKKYESSPAYEANKRKEREDRRAEVEAAYKEMYGDKEEPKSQLQSLLKQFGGRAGGAIGELMGGGEALAAIGPAGIAMAVKAAVDAVNSAVIGGIKGTVGAVASVANFAASANADPSVHVEQFGRSVSAVGEQISDKLSPVLGWMTVAVGETAAALGGLMRNIDEVAKRYAEFSPEISQAQAIAEIRHTMGDFRRAQEISGEMAKYLMAQSDLQQKFEDMKVKILAKILPAVTKMLEIMEAMPTQGIETAVGHLATALQIYLAPLEIIAGLMYKKDFEEIADPTDALFLPDTHAESMQTPQG